MEILTAAEMGAVDRDSNERGVPVRVLMENAGEAVARFCRERLRRVWQVVCSAAKETTVAMGCGRAAAGGVADSGAIGVAWIDAGEREG